MAYNINIVDKKFKALPNQINLVKNTNYGKINNREATIILNELSSFNKAIIKGNALEGKELFKHFIRTNFMQNNNNVTHINFLLYDYVKFDMHNPFLSYNELIEKDGNLEYCIKLSSIEKELQEDISGNTIPFFKICSEYKFKAIKDNFIIINDVLEDLGISYKVIYCPNPYYPEYSNELLNVNATSPFIYGMNFNEFEEKYHHSFSLNSDIDKEIDTISCKDEISWLSSKYYEDVYTVISIIKDINPLVEVGLGIDYYTHFGNYCHDDLLLLDNNHYSNFQEQILFNEDFIYPFADFIYIDNINYDYCIVPNKHNPQYSNAKLSLVDIRTINERIDLVCSKYKYPLDRIEIGFMNIFGSEEELSFLKTLNTSFFNKSYSLTNVMNDDNISRRFPFNENEDSSNKINYERKKENNAFNVEEKISVLDYLRKIYIIPVEDYEKDIEFDLNNYNGMMLTNLKRLVKR